MTELVDAVADLLVASGVGTGRYTTSGTSVQVNMRRDLGSPTVMLLTQFGGVAAAKDQTEDQAFQVLVDSSLVSGAQAKAREVFNFLHERTAETLSGLDVLYIRAVAPPQAVPTGPGSSERFLFSINFTARIRKQGDS